MDQKDPLPTLDAALKNLDPTRRRFLGLMLAGAATLPALTTTALAAQDSAKNVKQTIKPSTSTDKNSTIKDKYGVQNAAPGGPRKAQLDPSAKEKPNVKGASPSDKEKVGPDATVKSSDSNTVKGSDSKTVKGSDSQTTKAPDSTVKSSGSQSKSAPQDKQKPSTSDSHIYMK